MAPDTDKDALVQIEEICTDALDPILTRESVIQKLKEIYDIAFERNDDSAQDESESDSE